MKLLKVGLLWLRWRKQEKNALRMVGNSEAIVMAGRCYGGF
nr:hypothetical protein [uncultured Anaeromusa sp.]